MRAVAIFGPGCSAKDLQPFQRNSDATWLIDFPANSNDADAILIFGGDGTVHRHLAQLVQLHLPVLVVPCGSGNDFARALKLRRIADSLAAWRKFVTEDGSNVRSIDLGLITALAKSHAADTSFTTEKLFCCVGGVGLDGDIARRANRLPRWVRAHGGYALSFPMALLRFSPVRMQIALFQGGRTDELVPRNAQETMVAAFANAPAYGGGLKIAPYADLDDGKIDLCVVNNMSKLKLFCLFPVVYFGRHLGIPQVEYFQTERLRLETEEPVDVYADGEYVCRTPIEVSVVRQALPVIVP